MLHHFCQKIFYISEWIQVVRFCCFYDAVDQRAGLCPIDRIDQFPGMFMQAEAPECPFCRIVVKRNIPVI